MRADILTHKLLVSYPYSDIKVIFADHCTEQLVAIILLAVQGRESKNYFTDSSQ